jgi:CO/xanthine dehydrogenase Mo-binding subunit
MIRSTTPRPTRRAILQGGALIVSFSLLPRAVAQEARGAAEPKLPGSLKASPLLDSWIKIDSAGKVTVFTGKSELGQGIKTALLQIAAEQLDVAVKDIAIVTSDTARTPDEGYTAGSQSMQNSGTAIMHAAAQARAILIGFAASRLSVPASELTVENGTVRAPNGQSLNYGELAAGGVLHEAARPISRLKDPSSFKVMGQAQPRVDIPAKLTGGPAYVQDLRLDGMVHARVVRPPSYGATLRTVDTATVSAMPGVKKVVRDGNYLAVIADKEFRAIKAMEVLAASAKWDERETMPSPDEFYAWIKQQPGKPITIKDVKTAAAPAAKTLQAEYRRPHQMHGSIGPSCAVAQFVDGNLTVWSHGQGMFPLREAVSQLLKLPKEQVRCIHVEGSGCYGHNGADDAGADAAYLAVAYPDAPVRVQWMREQEHQWEPYGPGMVMDVKASLDAAGNIVAWDFANWTDTHSMRPGGAGATLVGRHIAAPFPAPAPQPGSQPSGFGDRNIIPLYKIPNLHLVYNFVPHQRVRVSALRGLGAYANVFAIESFMDELAAAAGADPVAFRLKHLTDRRAIDVVKLAATKFGWQPRNVQPNGRGRGFAFAKYKNLACYCAVAVELEIEHETGAVRLIRAVAAADSGQVVNPDGIRNQIEGGIVQSASWTLYESVAFDRTRINSRDWSTYPILRFDNLFESVTVEVINRGGQPFLGTGEAAQGPTGAAIANAIADATGQRIRELPFTRKRVKAAIGV